MLGILLLQFGLAWGRGLAWVERQRKERGNDPCRRKEEPYTEEQDLPVLTPEKSCVEIIVERRRFPNAVAWASSSVWSEMWCRVTAHVRPENVITAINGLHIIGQGYRIGV
jgi:hypothetical protein